MAGLGFFSRTEMLIGTAAMEKLATSHVMVFGIGGVGSFTVEALVRAGFVLSPVKSPYGEPLRPPACNAVIRGTQQPLCQRRQGGGIGNSGKAAAHFMGVLNSNARARPK